MTGMSFFPTLFWSAGRGQGIRVSFVSLFVSLLLAQSMVLVKPEIVALDMILDASSDEVHFVRGFLQAPASIDLSDIRWITDEDIVFDFGDDVNQFDYTDDAEYAEDDEYETPFPSLTEFETQFPVVEAADSAGDNNTSKNEDNARVEGNGNDGEDDISGEGITNDKEKVDPFDPVIPSENETNNNEDGEGGDSENASEPPKPTTEPEDKNKGEDGGQATTTVEDNISNNEQNEGNDQSEGETTNEAGKNNDIDEETGIQSSFDNESEGEEGEVINEEGNIEDNQDQQEPVSVIPSEEENDVEGEEENGTANEDGENDENDLEEEKPVQVTPSEVENDIEGEKEKETVNEEGAIDEDDQEEEDPAPVTPSEEENDIDIEGEKEKGTANEGENDEDAHEEEEPAPVTPSEEENDIQGEEEEKGGGIINEVGSNNDKDDEEEEELALVAPSEDKNNNGGDKIDGEVGENLDENNDNEQNGERGEPQKDQTDNIPVTASMPGDGAEEPASAPVAENNSPTEVGGDRSLQDTDSEGSTTTSQIMDIALFLEPADCKSDVRGNCDWVTLGVGSYDDEMYGEMSYCCSKDTAERGICNFDDIGTMLIDHENFKGDHRKIQVPSAPYEDFVIEDASFDVQISGYYVMVIANCNDDGLGILTFGNMEWKSVGGYLPGDIFGLMFFYGAMTAIYLVLGLWYYCGMKMFQDAAIPIQTYFLVIIILGFLATAFQGINLFAWNITGVRSPVVEYAAIVLGILFQGSLRCLGVMVAMGWGVVRDTLGMALCKIILLGLLYSGLTLVRDSLDAAALSAQLVSSTEKEELIDLVKVLSFIIICINIIFCCWIISSVRSTTEYLRNMNQTSKLRRHLRLRCLIIIFLIIIGILTVINVVQFFIVTFKSFSDNYDKDLKSILSQDQMWIIEAVGYGNYLFVLFGVTILWRPNADAKDYAMQMQLPALSDDENEPDLSCVVPSADDMDMTFGEGYKIDDAVVT